MKRNEWEVNYTGAKLAAAAEAKAQYHSKRLALWSATKEDVLKEIRTSGIEVNETLVDEMRKLGTYSTSNAQGHGPTVTIRDDLLVKLSEAHQKVAAHERLVKEYDAWQQMMHAHGEQTFNLRHDDYMFFLGK